MKTHSYIITSCICESFPFVCPEMQGAFIFVVLLFLFWRPLWTKAVRAQLSLIVKICIQLTCAFLLELSESKTQ